VEEVVPTRLAVRSEVDDMRQQGHNAAATAPKACLRPQPLRNSTAPSECEPNRWMPASRQGERAPSRQRSPSEATTVTGRAVLLGTDAVRMHGGDEIPRQRCERLPNRSPVWS
jgi:hypothetical protein